MVEETDKVEMLFSENDELGQTARDKIKETDDSQSLTTDGPNYNVRQVLTAGSDSVISMTGETLSEEKLVFRLIYRSDPNQADALAQHLLETKDKIDITNIYDRGGYSPLNYAAYKDRYMAFKVLIEFVQKREIELDNSENAVTSVSGQGGRSSSARNSVTISSLHHRLKAWIDLKEKG